MSLSYADVPHVTPANSLLLPAAPVSFQTLLLPDASVSFQMLFLPAAPVSFQMLFLPAGIYSIPRHLFGFLLDHSTCASSGETPHCTVPVL